MFDGASNVQLGGELMKLHYPKLTVMRGVEYIFSLFLNDVLKYQFLIRLYISRGNIQLI